MYNNFVDFFNGDSEIEDVNTNIKQYSTPLIVEKHERNPATVNLNKETYFLLMKDLLSGIFTFKEKQRMEKQIHFGIGVALLLTSVIFLNITKF
ncbi:MAG: hypothetical protein CM15mP26_2070 [Actinomycetota bacterium]|nr:MAG: hypothetical protein CM15mP26_2070 [Actinomycetota bacterium]